MRRLLFQTIMVFGKVKNCGSSYGTRDGDGLRQNQHNGSES